jgi:hypothetical protein
VTLLLAWPSQKRIKSSGACCFLSHVVRNRLKAWAPSHSCGLRALPSDEQNVLEAVTMELRHGRQVIRQCFTLSSLQRFDELLDGLICDVLDVF